MTFTFKLSRRLAMSSYIATVTVLPVLTVLVACAGGDTTGPADASAAAIALRVNPRQLTLETNQQVRFAGHALTATGDTIDDQIEWTATGGSISADGLFSSSTTGTFKIIGRGRTKKTDTSTVEVVPPQPTLQAVVVSPGSASLLTGGTQTFTATGQLSDGATTSVGVVWTATGGTIDPGGNYVAGSTAGTFRVIAASTTGTLADTAAVTITAPAPAPAPTPTLTQVVLSPASASLLTGGTKQFASYGRMSDGDSVAVTVTYSATGGTITSGGLYTAGTTAGTFRVIASHSSGPADTAAVTITAPAPAPAPTTAFTGIPLGGFHTPAANLGSTFTGFLRTIYIPSLPATLDSARARKGRIVLAVPRSKSRNADGTFNLDIWKQEIDRYRAVNLQPYIDDGTILGLYVVDEPNCSGCWGGSTISQATVDEMARYVKSIWPKMVTFARIVPGWFLSYGPPRYLDAAWAQWEGPLHLPSYRMTPEQFRDKQVADAKALGLGLIMGMNTLDGGDGSSGIWGTYNLATVSTRWQMSAAEVERVGSIFAATPYVCGMLNWRWSPDYPTSTSLTTEQLAAIRAFDTRTDVKAAFAKVAQVAASRTPAPCRVR